MLGMMTTRSVRASTTLLARHSRALVLRAVLPSTNQHPAAFFSSSPRQAEENAFPRVASFLGWSGGSYHDTLALARAENHAKTVKRLRFLSLAFREFDRNKSNLLSKEDLKHAMVALNLPSEDADVQALFQEIDKDQDDLIQLSEWLDHIPEAVQEKLRMHAKAEVWRKQAADQDFLHVDHEGVPWAAYEDFHVKTRSKQDKKRARHLRFLALAFREFDQSKTNLLSKEDVKRAMVALKLPSEDADVQALFQEIDTNQDNLIQLSEWLDHIPEAVQEKLHGHAKAEQWRREVQVMRSGIY